MSIKIVHRKLGRERADGLAYTGHNEIHIDERLKKKEYMRITIHELLHMYFPDLSESKVDKISRKMCGELWKLKFRRTDS
jgi:hypothetical protein